MPVHRVSFSGPLSSERARDTFTKVGAYWEATQSSLGQDCRHHVLLDAPGAEQAEALVRSALQSSSAFHGFTTQVFEEYGAGAGRRPFVPPSEGPDWSDVATRVELTATQQDLLESLLNADEPTWLLAKERALRFDRAEVELALADLKSRGLVSSTREDSANGPPGVMDDWWAVTVQAWDLLGLITPWWH